MSTGLLLVSLCKVSSIARTLVLFASMLQARMGVKAGCLGVGLVFSVLFG